MLRRLPTLTPRQYTVVATVALVALVGIVFTGAGVRLTGSGLGCPDWPKCYGRVIAPLETHAIIEYGNRILSGLVGIVAVAAGVLAWRRRPFRKHLALFGALLPLGIVAQAVLGGFTVRNHLAPGFVMAHFVLSMLIIDAAFALFWCSRREPGDRPRATDPTSVWAVRALLPLGALTIFVGTAATAAGPHAGGAGTGDEINRLDFRGVDTLSFMVERHSAVAVVFGLATCVVWLVIRHRGFDRGVRRALGAVLALLVAQGAVGIAQWSLELPAELVWIHVVLAVATWLSVLWSVGAAGLLEPRTARARVGDGLDPAREALGLTPGRR